MRALIGFIAGIAVAVTATAYAHGTKTMASSPCIRSAGGGVVCHLPKPPAKQPYAGSEVFVDGLDLHCSVLGAIPKAGAALAFSCQRTDRPLGQCVGGYDGSLFVAFEAFRTEIDKPSHCIANGSAVGFKDTYGRKTYTFTRAP